MRVRADAGYFSGKLIGWLETEGLGYVVVARDYRGIKARAQAASFQPLRHGWEVGEFRYAPPGWKTPRRYELPLHRRLANRTLAGYYPAMTTTVDAIYEHGKLVLPRPLSLPEKSQVRVTIESDPERDDAFNGLLLSESALAKDWNTPEEDAAWASL
jgi:hypothetical protein